MDEYYVVVLTTFRMEARVMGDSAEDAANAATTDDTLAEAIKSFSAHFPRAEVRVTVDAYKYKPPVSAEGNGHDS